MNPTFPLWALCASVMAVLASSGMIYHKYPRGPSESHIDPLEKITPKTQQNHDKNIHRCL